MCLLSIKNNILIPLGLITIPISIFEYLVNQFDKTLGIVSQVWSYINIGALIIFSAWCAYELYRNNFTWVHNESKRRDFVKKLSLKGAISYTGYLVRLVVSLILLFSFEKLFLFIIVMIIDAITIRYLKYFYGDRRIIIYKKGMGWIEREEVEF